MFSGLDLTDINFLRNWKVSNGIDFGRMFSNSSLKDTKALENWDLSNCKNFSGMFNHCLYLSDIKP